MSLPLSPSSLSTCLPLEHTKQKQNDENNTNKDVKSGQVEEEKAGEAKVNEFEVDHQSPNSILSFGDQSLKVNV